MGSPGVVKSIEAHCHNLSRRRQSAGYDTAGGQRCDAEMQLICPTQAKITAPGPLRMSSPPLQKYFCFPESKSRLYSPCPVPQRGVAQRHETRGGMRWTLVVPVTNGARADGKVVWSWRLDAGVKLVEATSQATETKKPISGESTKQPLTPSRAGMPGDSGGLVVTNSCAFYFAREAAGASRARHSPRPLGADVDASLGRFTPRERGLLSCRHCEERSDEAIQLSIRYAEAGLLRLRSQ